MKCCFVLGVAVTKLNKMWPTISRRSQIGRRTVGKEKNSVTVVLVVVAQRTASPLFSFSLPPSLSLSFPTFLPPSLFITYDWALNLPQLLVNKQSTRLSCYPQYTDFLVLSNIVVRNVNFRGAVPPKLLVLHFSPLQLQSLETSRQTTSSSWGQGLSFSDSPVLPVYLAQSNSSVSTEWVSEWMNKIFQLPQSVWETWQSTGKLDLHRWPNQITQATVGKFTLGFELYAIDITH